MPALTRWLVKLSLLYLIAALLMGILLAAAPFLPPALPPIWPTYLHVFLIGWITQLIFGIAYWMFPKLTLDQPRGSELLGWIMLVLLNAGLLLRIVGEPLNVSRPGAAWGWVLVISAILQWAAGLAFVVNSWNRIKVK